MGTKISLIVSGIMVGLAVGPAYAAHSGHVPVVEIVNTGSTNTRGYRVTVSASGIAYYTQTDRRGTVSTGKSQQEALPGSLTRRLFHDVRAAMPLTALPVGHGLKSTSFGTSTYLLYQGQQTPDLSFPANPKAQALAADVAAVTAALHLSNLSSRPVGPMRPSLPGR